MMNISHLTPQNLRLVFIASGGLAVFAHILFILPAVYAAYALKHELNFKAMPFQHRWVWWPAGLCMAFLVILQPMPADDLMAIVSIASGRFEHTSFLYSDWATLGFSPWAGYERVLQPVAHAFGPDVALRLAQTTAVISTLVAVTLAVSRQSRATAPQHWVIAVVLLAFSSDVILRAVGGRAEVLLLAWMTAAFWMTPWVWIVVGMILAPMYWLAWVYIIPGALLLRAAPRTRGLAMITLLSSAGIAWWVQSHGHYFELFALTNTWMDARQFTVGENIPVIAGLMSPINLAILCGVLFLLFKGAGRREDWPFLVAGAWFLLPDMTRYLAAEIILATIWMARAIPRVQHDLPSLNVMVIAVLMPLLMLKSLPTLTEDHLPRFVLPAGARVLAPMNSGLFATIYRNAGIRITPAFEPGSTAIAVQKASTDLGQGRFDCAVLTQYPVDFVVENALTALHDCLELADTQGSWRLWKTKIAS